MFEHSLIDLEAKTSPRRRWLSLPIAVGLHIAGLSAFAFASYWNVGSVQDPNLNIGPVTYFELPPPEGGGGGPQPKPKTQEIKKQEPQPAPAKTVQPNAETVPDKPPTPVATRVAQDLNLGPASNGPSTGPSFGPGPAGPGIGPGIGPGVGPSEGPGVGPGIGEAKPIRLSFGMTRPEIIRQVQPRYSEQARRAGVQGMVIVEAVIDELGQVTNVRLIQGLPMALDQAAMQAIQQWRFKPALLDGRAVKVFYMLTVNFTIQR
jgi:periplasmic protein TonB